MQTPENLVKILRSRDLRTRTGLILLPKHALNKQATLSAGLGIQHVSLPTYLLEQQQPDSKHIGISVDSLLVLLDSLSQTESGMDCVFLADFDLPFSRIKYEDRSGFWQRLMDQFPYKRKALIAALPKIAEKSLLLPDDGQTEKWMNDGRIAQIT